MKRCLLTIICLACLAGTASGQATQPPDGVASLLARLEQVLRDGSPDRYLDLLSGTANRDRAVAFARMTVTPGATRVVVRERDRSDLTGTLPGEGYQLLVEVFVETGARARVATWRLDVRARGSAAAPDWAIAGQEVLTTLAGLYRLSLNPLRELAVRDLTISAEDLRLTVPEGSVFMAETDAGPTALVVLGRGDMSFTPAPQTERGQLRLYAGTETLQSPFDSVFLRVGPSDLTDHLKSRETVERPVDPRDLKRAEEIFHQEIVKSFGLDLGDLSSDVWSLLPASGDLLAEIHTRRFDTLTYARSGNEIEDISLYDRRTRHNISVYSSQAHLAQYSRFYSEDEHADYVVHHYDLEVSFDPLRSWIDGRARLAIEVSSDSMGALTLHLADSMTVQSVAAVELGRLLCVRVRNQNSVVVNLPATLLRGYRFTLIVAYSGALAPQPVDREAIAPQLPQVNEIDEGEIPLQDSYLYSNRSYWYPQAPTLGYATASMRLIVPEQFTVVASGEPVAAIPAPGPVQRGAAKRLYSFEAAQPVRYLSCLISRLVEVRKEKIAIRDAAPSDHSTAAGVHYDEVEVSVKTSPRLKARGREIARSTTEIVRFYSSLIGDFPYPSLTVAAIERRLPGGHSPPYLSVVSQALPGSTLRWGDDPGALPDFPEFFLAHELAHQWWGQAVGWKNYHEQWLSEGFSQYFAALYAEHARGRGVFDPIVRRMQKWAVDESDQGPVYLGYRIGHVRGDSRLFRAVVYDKGAMVLHMMRRLVGDQAFFAGLRRFYTTWRFRKAGSDDLRAAMEAEAGISLDRFFERWVYGDAIPQIAFTWRVDAGGSPPELVLRFEQSGDVYDLPVTVSLDYADRPPAQIIVKITDRVSETRVPLSGRLRRVDVNRDQGALATFR